MAMRLGPSFCLKDTEGTRHLWMLEASLFPEVGEKEIGENMLQVCTGCLALKET